MYRIVTAGIILLFVLSDSCQRRNRPITQAVQVAQPTIAIAPLEQGRGQWQVASAEEVSITVTAPGATQIRILSYPEGSVDEAPERGEARLLELHNLQTTAEGQDSQKGKFVVRLKLPPDFAAQVWAEIMYADGMKKGTEPIALAATAPNLGHESPREAGGSIGTDESARSDKLTGGHIRRAMFHAGEPEIRITVNLPAFTLTLWQKGAEVGVYPIGIGRKNFPVPVGEREATEIIFNPTSIPPGSAWMQSAGAVTPSEKSAAAGPRNPLGRIKIPIGEGYLIHETARPSDIGRLNSDGCIRMLRGDLVALTEKILAARTQPITKSQVELADKNAERLALKLDAPLLVDINYDLQVIENGVLHLYPDVYGRGAFALDGLRAELQGAGLRGITITDLTLQRLLDRVQNERQYILSLSDIRRGRWAQGRSLPLVESWVEIRGEHASGR